MFGLGMFKLISWTIFFIALTKALAVLRTSITTNVLIFLGGIIVLYAVSKYFEHRGAKLNPIPKDMANAPPDYVEYLKYREMAKKYERTEPVTVQKFLLGFTQGKNWAKSLAIGVMIVVILFVGASVYKEVKGFFVKTPPPVSSTITNTGGGTVEAKTESKSTTKQSNGLNLNFLSNWF